MVVNPGTVVTKHIFVTGGVVSSLGKGLTAASLGNLPEPSAADAGALPAGGAAAGPIIGAGTGWLQDLQREARRLLESGDPEVWDTLTRQFEGQLIHTALDITRGRRIEAAHKLGIGRNTITRKIQELGLED